MTGILEVDDLRVAFRDGSHDERTVVDGVSLDLAEGDVVALVGESGCGKTMSALAVVRLLPPGAVLAARRLALAGVDVLAADERAMALLRGGAVGVALQEPASALNPVRSVGDQIAESARLHLGLPRRAAREAALALLAEGGLEASPALLDAYPFQLSGGQRQRALLAAALSGQPRVLIADEPTSALDTISARRIMTLLARLHDSRRLAMVLISHDLPMVAREAARVAVLYAGETVETAPRDELFSWPLHPYTAALVAMMPQRGRRRRSRLPALPGRVPQPLPRAAGCRFAARCPRAFGRCREARPALVAVERERQVRCFLHSSVEQVDG